MIYLGFYFLIIRLPVEIKYEFEGFLYIHHFNFYHQIIQ
jgi:hypothetical protein